MTRHMRLRHWLEREDLEFKSGRPWKDLRSKLVKTALAMANLQGGGYIVIGVREGKGERAHEIDAMPETIARTYSADDVSEYFNTHADPDIDVEVVRFEHGGKYVVAIQVHEFKEVPVICKKGIGDHVRRGVVYCRSPKPETVPANAKIMREIIEMAVDRGIAKQRSRSMKQGADIDAGLFTEETRAKMGENANRVILSIIEKGHWEVTIRPSRPGKFSLASLKDALTASRVKLRGMYYPHVASKHGEMYNMDGCVEAWMRWGEFAEVFQFYRSGQFVHYMGMVEDRDADCVPLTAEWVPRGEPPTPEHPFLRAKSALYYLTEIYLFASNLAARNMLGDRADIGITLHKQDGRALRYGDGPGGLPQASRCRSASIRLGLGRVATDRLRADHDAMAIADGVRLMEAYNEEEEGLGDALQGWQANFYRRRP